MINLLGIVSFKKNLNKSKDNIVKLSGSMKYFGIRPKIKFSQAGIDLVADYEKIKGKQKKDLIKSFTNKEQTIFLIADTFLLNYKQLREKLEKKGYLFSTDFHEEAIIHLYEDCGLDFLEMLNGNFLCVLWDEKKKIFVIATDRFNTKPIYYTVSKDQLIFSNTIKLLLSYGIPRNLDKNSLVLLFKNKWNALYAPKTLIKNVFQLTNSTAIITKNGKINYKKYWDIKFNPQKISYSYVVKKFRQLLEDSIKGNSELEKKICISLSGGIDSGLIVAIMNKFNDKIKTFNFVYKDGWDERPDARTIAKEFSTDHSEIDISFRDIYDNLLRATWHSDKFNTAMLSEIRILLCEKAKKDADLIFVGHGADEVLELQKPA